MFIYFALLCAFTSAMQDDQNNALLNDENNAPLNDQQNEMQNLVQIVPLNNQQNEMQNLVQIAPLNDQQNEIALKQQRDNDHAYNFMMLFLSIGVLICTTMIWNLPKWQSTVNMADVCVLHKCHIDYSDCFHYGESAIPTVTKYFMTTTAASAPFCLYTYDATNYCVKFTKKNVGQLAKWVKNQCKSWGYSCPEKCGSEECDVLKCHRSVVKYIDDANRLSGEDQSILEHCKANTCAEASAYYGKNNEAAQENLEELFEQNENIEK